MHEYPKHPRVGVGTVVFKGEEVLLIRRLNEPDRGMWSIPGGGAKSFEALIDGARREVEEECSVDVRIDGLVGVRKIIQRDEVGRVRFHYVLMEFFGDYMGGTVQAQSDALEAKWVHIGEVDGLHMPDRVKGVIREAAEIRGSGQSS
jgi:ADP-ribose pyrophosphatase YjhB (NUDIX family)